MRLILVLLVAIAIAAEIGFVKPEDELEDESQKQLPSARSRYKLPSIFDFNIYKTLFNKHYKSILEEVARQRLFLARAFWSFITAVSYKHNKSNSYLKINQMSDWTPEELKATLMKADIFADEDQVILEDEEVSRLDEQEILPVADLKDIERKFEEIVEHEGDEPGYEEISKELSENRRTKRDVEEGREGFSVQELIKKFECSTEGSCSPFQASHMHKEKSFDGPAEHKFTTSEPEGNQEAKDELMSRKEAEEIEKKPGEGFLSNVIKATSALFSRSRHHTGQEEKSQNIVYNDYRKSHCYLPPRDQNGCACCYAFAAIAMYEWVYCMATGKPLEFSVQYPIDCGSDVGLRNCEHAKYQQLSDFTKKYGLETLTNYPYIGKGGKCPYDKEKSRPEEMGFIRFEDQGWLHIPLKKFETQLKKSPIVVNMLVTDQIHQYGGGVDDGAHCDPDYRHSALLIGSGIEDDQHYWLFRFAFSEAFGEFGHFKLNKKSKCLHRFGSVLRANFKKDPQEDLNPNYNSKPVEELKKEYLQINASRQQ